MRGAAVAHAWRSMSRPESNSHVTRRHGSRFTYVLFFVGWVMVVDAFAGENGLSALIRARRQFWALEGSLAVTRSENVRLREDARRLRGDPATIEAVARRELGLIRPGERLFIVRDARASAPP